MSHFIFLIDTSFSMYLHIKNVVDGLNNFLYKLNNNNNNKNNTITVGTFNSGFNGYIVKNASVSSIDYFKEKDFITSGCTSLYDSICSILLDFGISRQPVDTYFFILTDGEDSISRTYTKERTEELCNIAINIGKWNIIHCHTDISMLNLPTVNFDTNDISSIFNALKI
jgi:uncharacterized protein YegL